MEKKKINRAQDLFHDLCTELHDDALECMKEHLFEDLPNVSKNGQFMVTSDIQQLAAATELSGEVMGLLDELRSSLEK